jgi:hypothetical protein
VRSVRRPKPSGRNPRASSSVRSNGTQPPSGPIASASRPLRRDAGALLARVQEPPLPGAEQRVHPVLHEGAEAWLDRHLGEHRVLRLLEPVEQVLPDALRGEDRRGEVALLHPGRGEKHQPVHAQRRGGGEHAPERLGPRDGDYEIYARSRRWWCLERDPEHGLGLAEHNHLRGADAAAQHAHADGPSGATPAPRGDGAARTAEPRRSVGGQLIWQKQEEIHRAYSGARPRRGGSI